MVLRAPHASGVGAWRLDDDSTLLLAFGAKGAPAAFALVRGDRVERVAGLEKGGPPLDDPSAVTFGGTLPADLWAARSEGKSACEVSHWDGSRWSAPTTTKGASCVEIHSRGEGSAVAAMLDAQARVSLRAFGQSANAPSTSACPELCQVLRLATWPSSGEVALAGIACPQGKRTSPLVAVEHWARGESKATCGSTNYDANSPVIAYAGDPGQIVLSGVSIRKGSAIEQNLESLETRYAMSHGQFDVLEEKSQVNEFERWHAVSLDKPATPIAEGFTAGDMVFGAIGEAFVPGFLLEADGSRTPVGLRSKPVISAIDL